MRQRMRFLFAGCLLACSLNVPQSFARNIITSPSDDASYEAFTLENGLEVLLVSDPETDKAAAALSVNIGAGSDPAHRQGLAHFLEHMLFLGTQKYPQPGEYHEFIRSNGGSQNAYTTYDFTTYFFDIEPSYIEPALDRFAQFFIAPLFDPKYVERELQAVESEFRTRVDDDNRRRIEAEKTVFNQEHPYSQFQGGNRESLETEHDRDIRKDMLEFYQKNYSAGLMTLVVYAREPIDVLHKWVMERFEAVPNTGAVVLVPTQSLFTKGQLPVRINVVPKREQRNLHLAFPIPPVLHHYQSKPLAYLGNLLGHEGQGSLLSALKNRGWADTLSAGGGLSRPNEATFSIYISLTESGVEHVDEVVDLVFEQIQLIRSSGVREWSFREQGKLSDLGFRFKQDQEPADYVVALATSLHRYPAEHVLYGPYSFEHWAPQTIEEIVEHLTPQNMMLTVTAKNQPTDEHSRWLKTPFSVSSIEPPTLARWAEFLGDEALELPAPNAFIPEDLALRNMGSPAAAKPKKIEQRPGLAVWHQRDPSFGSPRASYFVSLQSPRAIESVRSVMLTRLYISIVNDLLNEFSYPATLAGLGYNLYPTQKGMTIRVSGYSDKQPLILKKILTALAQPDIRKDRFDILKERLLRRLRNAKFNDPYQQARAEVGRLLVEPSWTHEEQIAALEPLSVKNLREFVPTLTEQLYVLTLSHGNATNDDARAMTEIVLSELAATARPNPLPESLVVKLDSGDRVRRVLEIDHEDSVIALYVQGDNRKYPTRARFALLAQILSSPFFTELRTEKQLGYVVFAAYDSVLGVPGIQFVVQSPVALPSELEQYVNEFIQHYVNTLSDMSAETFEAQKAGLVSTLLEEDKTLWERTVRYWYEIDRFGYEFDTNERLANAVQALQRDEFVSFYRRVMLSEERKTILVSSTGRTHLRANAASAQNHVKEHVVDARAFRSAQSFFDRRGETRAATSE